MYIIRFKCTNNLNNITSLRKNILKLYCNEEQKIKSYPLNRLRIFGYKDKIKIEAQIFFNSLDYLLTKTSFDYFFSFFTSFIAIRFKIMFKNFSQAYLLLFVVNICFSFKIICFCKKRQNGYCCNT